MGTANAGGAPSGNLANTKLKASGKKHVHYTVDLYECPRCGGDHEGEPSRSGDGEGKIVPGSGSLMFTPLTNPSEGSQEDLWAFCEVASEPVLLASKDVE